MRILCASFACGKGSRALETWWFGASGFEPTTEKDARQEEDERSKCKKCVRWHSTIRWTSTNHRLVHVDRERIAFAWRDPSSFRKSDWSWQTKGNVETAGPGRATCTTASSTIHRARRCVSRPYGATRRWSTWRCVGCAVARRGGLETEFVWRVYIDHLEARSKRRRSDFQFLRRTDCTCTPGRPAMLMARSMSCVSLSTSMKSTLMADSSGT